jgi:predicted Zn-dependent protease with MMP-like domain
LRPNMFGRNCSPLTGSGEREEVFLLLFLQKKKNPYSARNGAGSSGSVSRTRRSAARLANRCSNARRRAGANGCSGGSRSTSASSPAVTISPTSSGSSVRGKSVSTAKLSVSQKSRYAGHFESDRKSAAQDFTSTQANHPSGRSASKSARRPFGSRTSCSTAHPNRPHNRAAARRTNAVRSAVASAPASMLVSLMPEFTTPPSPDDIADLAERALDAIPPELSRHVRGVAIQVEDAADDDTLHDLGLESPWELAGLYHGVPIGHKSALDIPRPPDMIFLYREALLLEWIETGEDLFRLVRSVLIHEIAHHFGFSDADIERIENSLD